MSFGLNGSFSLFGGFDGLPTEASEGLSGGGISGGGSGITGTVEEEWGRGWRWRKRRSGEEGGGGEEGEGGEEGRGGGEEGDG